MTNQDRIKKLKAQIEKLEKGPKLKATGNFNVVIEDTKGKVIHTFTESSKRNAILKRNNFYKVLVLKLKQKASIRVQPELKEA